MKPSIQPKPHGTMETLEVTALFDENQTLGYFLDAETAKEACNYHGFTGPASTKTVEIDVIWVNGVPHTLGLSVLDVKSEATRIKELEGQQLKNYLYARGYGASPHKALLKVLG